MRTIEEIIQEIEYEKQEIGHIIDDRSRKGIPFLPYVEEYKFLSRLEEICNAERDGRLVVLPCGVDLMKIYNEIKALNSAKELMLEEAN